MDSVIDDLLASWTLLNRHLLVAGRTHHQVETRFEDDVANVFLALCALETAGVDHFESVEYVWILDVLECLVFSK